MSVRLPAVTRRAMSWSFVLVSLVLPAHRAAAQTAVDVMSEQRPGQMPDSAPMSAALAMPVRMRRPAKFALSMQKEIGLAAQQVAALEVLVRTQSDSESVRALRMTQQLQTTSRGSSPTAAMAEIAAWTGPVQREMMAGAFKSVGSNK